MKTLLSTKQLGLATAGMLFWANIVQAASIELFSDNFNRSNANTVGNGWAEIQNGNSDVAIENNTLLLRDYRSGDGVVNPDAAATITPAINAEGYQNLLISFSWSPLFNSEGSDDLYLSFATSLSSSASSWTTLWSTGLGGNTSFHDVVLSGSLLNPLTGLNAIFLRFWTDVSDSENGNSEGAYIDNVVISADLITNTSINQSSVIAISEPNSVAVFALGASLLFGFRRNVASDS